MTAMVIWPGATSQQVQDEVLNRMEKKFEQIDHYEKVVTFARQGFGGMTLTVRGGTSKDDQLEAAWYQARKKFSDIKLELPEGVVGPIFNDEYGDVYNLMYAVKGDGIGQAELGDIAEDVKRRLLRCRWSRRWTCSAGRASACTSSSRTSVSPPSASRRCRLPRA